MKKFFILLQFLILIFTQEYPRNMTQFLTIKPMFDKIQNHSLSHLLSATKYLSENFVSRSAYNESGVIASKWLLGEYLKRLNGIEPNRRSLFELQEFSHPNFEQKSLIIKMKGRSPKTVILGAHFDSFLSNPNVKAPGADDNAIGAATVLEVFTILARYSKFVPSKTIEFHAYAGHHPFGNRGTFLDGSAQIASSYKNQNKDIHAVILAEEIGYNPNNKNKIGIQIGHNATESLVLFAMRAIKSYLRTDYQTVTPGGGDSISWAKQRYPNFAYRSSDTNPHSHKETDTLDKLDFNFCVEYVRAIISQLVELSYN
jgi:bacterial leucyl aminopeptidase